MINCASLTRLLTATTVAAGMTATLFSGTASAQIHSRAEPPASQLQSTPNGTDGVIKGHGAEGTDSNIQSTIQTGVGAPPDSTIQAGECGLVTWGWHAYYRHCGGTNVPIYVEWAWGPDSRICVGPWTTTNLSDHPALQGRSGWITGARWSGWDWC